MTLFGEKIAQQTVMYKKCVFCPGNNRGCYRDPGHRFFIASGYTDHRFEAGVLTPGQRPAWDSDDVAACTHWDLLCMQHRA